jgi:hypothetical protein
MKTEILTTKLRDGRTVLAKLYEGEPSAVTYANLKQAQAAADKHGGWVAGRWPFYVCFDPR